VARDTEGSGKKDSEPRKEEGHFLEKKETEQMKTETDKQGEIVAEAPEAEEQQVEQAPEASEEEADSAPAELSPEQRVEQLVEENDELQDKFVRLMADFDNYKKRASKEKSDVIQFGNEGLLKDILPIIDNIERLLTYSYREGSWKSFQEGVELLLAESNKTLAKYGVESIEALGKTFDPNIHQAMQRSETDEVEANTVVEVYQKGYLYRSRLLRPSLVVVAVPPKGEEEEEEEEEGEESAPGPDDPGGEAGDKGEDEEQPIN
jgi:molecular chaperone GrpE